MAQPPKFTERLWSHEVAQAEASDPLPLHDTGYEFSNGRKFHDGHGPYGRSTNPGPSPSPYVDAYFSIATGQKQVSAGIADAGRAVAILDVATAQGQGNAGVAQPVIAAGVMVARTASVAGAATGTAAVSGAVAAPSPGAIAVGSQIAPLTVQNLSTTATATNQPFSIGHAFAQGHLPAAGAAVTLNLPDGTAIPAQLNVKATHADGSVRHAKLSGIVPSIAVGSSVALSMKRAAAPAAGANVSLPASLPYATINIGGAIYTAKPTNSDPYMTWVTGPVFSDFIFSGVPFKNASGTAHPTIKAQFSVKVFSNGAVKVDYVTEDCQAYGSTSDTTYDAVLYGIDGQPVYSINALVHSPTGRWKKTFWQGAAPTIHVKHDVPYLLDSWQVANLDRSITIAETYLSGLATAFTSGNFEPMKFGRFRAYMPDYGGRPDIGLMPDSHAALVLSMDKRAWDVVMGAGDIGGSWPMCRRDDSTGPGRGLPISVINFPYSSILGNFSDCNNPATGKNEHFPNLTTASIGVPDSAHMPDIYYVPYLLSGDYFYLEGLQFCCMFNHYVNNPGYRGYGLGLLNADQVRGQGWSLRTLGECAAITPDDHYLKSHCSTLYDNNITWYVNTYVPGIDNPLNIITHGYAIAYNVNGSTENGTAPWMDDFWMQGLHRSYELLRRSSVVPLLMWKAKFQVERMNNPAICVLEACVYELGVRTGPAPAPFFNTLADCWNYTISAARQAYPCGSPGRLAGTPCLPGDIDGYPASESGFPANYQPALAAAKSIGYPGSDTAWAKFMARPTKPNYGLYGAQFAVVPR